MKDIILNFNIISRNNNNVSSKKYNNINKRRKYTNFIINNDYAEFIIYRKNKFIHNKIDIIDAKLLNNHSWRLRGNYIYNAHNNILLHRAIINNMGLIIPKNYVVDHINGDTTDNRRCNLRVVSKTINTLNSKTKFKGYRYRKDIGAFEVRIKYKQKVVTIGYFTNENDAHEAYINAWRKYYPHEKLRSLE